MKPSPKTKIIVSLALAAIFSGFLGGQASAQQDSSMILSITPPLFKVNMKPGETWSSVVKVVNNNAYPVTVYTQVADFKSGEAGGVEFVKSEPDAAGKGYTLSQWLEITSEPVEISAFGSKDVPFKVMLPQTADPGGHYAAILVGNKPIDNTTGSVVKISSKLASLLLVRVAGEVVEKGDVREFSTSKDFAKKTEADFTVRFVNKGNVHLRPEGEVKITNMFGQTRGVISINKKSEFGNVLPESEKKWEFNWKGESSIWDAGRMQAELFLSYGEEGKQSEVRKINFWVVNLKPTLIVLGSLLLVVLLFIFFVRRFIKKSISKARMEADALAGRLGRTAPAVERPTASVKAPAGKMDGVVVNLRDAGSNSNNLNNKTTKLMNWSFLKNVLLFIVVALIVVAGAFFYSQYKKNSSGSATEDNAPKSTGVTVINNGATSSAQAVETVDETATTTATSTEAVATSTDAMATSTEAVATSTATTTAEALPNALDKKDVKLNILNGSGVTGVSGKAAKIIEDAGYVVASKGNAANFNFAVTEITYGPDVADNALAIDQLVGGDSKLTEDPAASGKITVTLGKNFK